MAKCEQCDNEFQGRAGAKYCSGKCRVAAHRVTDKPVTDIVTDTDLEKCRYCGKPLPVLQKPRRYPGACYECAVKQPAPITKDNTLSSRPAIEFTGQMTDFEREHYKPAEELGRGEYNPVSKPGQEHYGVFDKKAEGVAWGVKGS